MDELLKYSDPKVLERLLSASILLPMLKLSKRDAPTLTWNMPLTWITSEEPELSQRNSISLSQIRVSKHWKSLKPSSEVENLDLSLLIQSLHLSLIKNLTKLIWETVLWDYKPDLCPRPCVNSPELLNDLILRWY